MPISSGQGDRGREALARRALAGLYAACRDLASGRSLACGPGCFACCTDRVLLTTLEAKVLSEGLLAAGREDLLARARSRPVDPAARPASTMNSLARHILARSEPPAESEPQSPPGPCPLLEDGLCAAYQVRPLACRTMVSLERCAPGGQAREEELYLGVSSALFQMAEQIDLGGGFGLMPEVLAAVAGAAAPRPAALLTCEVLPGLPTPPQHQAEMQRILQRIFAQPVDGVPLGQVLDMLRTGP